MKVIVKLDVSDLQANALACLLAGKQVKRLATRKEVTAFVEGAMGTLVDGSTEDGREATATKPASVPTMASRHLTESEEEIAERLRAEGRDASYIRGYIAAGRSSRYGR